MIEERGERRDGGEDEGTAEEIGEMDDQRDIDDGGERRQETWMKDGGLAEKR